MKTAKHIAQAVRDAGYKVGHEKIKDILSHYTPLHNAGRITYYSDAVLHSVVESFKHLRFFPAKPNPAPDLFQNETQLDRIENMLINILSKLA